MSLSNRINIEHDSLDRDELLLLARQITEKKKEVRELRRRQNALLASISARHLENPGESGTKRLLRDLAAA